MRGAQRHGRRAKGRFVEHRFVALGSRGRGASETSAATPSNTVWQWPQRTWPARSASCCGVTRKIVLQPGTAREFLLSHRAAPNAAALVQGAKRTPASATHPSALPHGAILNHRTYAAATRVGLRLQDSGKDDVAAGPHALRQQRGEELERIGEDIGHDHVEAAPCRQLLRRARIGARPRWRRRSPGSRRSPADRCRPRPPGPRQASPRRSPGFRSRSRNRAPMPARATFSASQRRHSRVVGWLPVPKAQPGSSRTLTAAGSTGSRHEGTIHNRSLTRSGANCAWVSRTQSASAIAASECAGGGSVELEPRRWRAPPRRRTPRQTARRVGLTGQGAASASPGSPYSGRLAAACRRAHPQRRPKARRRRAARPPSAPPHPRRRRSRARDTAFDGRQRRRVRRRTCASPSAARGSGSTCHRGGTSPPAAAPGAAECWS